MADDGELTIEEAKAMLFARPEGDDVEEDLPGGAEEATPEPESPARDDADPEEAPREDKEADPAAEPPIERPKSWTEAEDAEWQATPRALQQKIVARELERDTAIRRAQNEAAEERKALAANREAAEKAKAQYEAQLPALMQTLESAQQAAFSDIRTVDDVAKLAAEDPFRYLQWQAHQTKMQAVKAEMDRSAAEKTAKQQSDWQNFRQEQDKLAAEHIPELADPVKGPALVKRAADRLIDLGFTQDELNKASRGEGPYALLYDHRMQRVLASDLRLADIQSAPKAVAAKPLPPVQKPGSGRPAGQADSANIQALEKRFNQTGDVKDAWALMQAREQSRRAS